MATTQNYAKINFTCISSEQSHDESTIAHHVQHLSAAIIQERIERVQAIANIQVQIFELRAAFDALSTNTVPAQHLRESRSNEVVDSEL